MLNLLSLCLGLLAWICGGSAALRGKFGGWSFASLSLCAVSLTLQLYELKRRADIGDFAAIEDTIGGVVFAGTVLLAVTAALNLLAFLRRK